MNYRIVVGLEGVAIGIMISIFTFAIPYTHYTFGTFWGAIMTFIIMNALVVIGFIEDMILARIIKKRNVKDDLMYGTLHRLNINIRG